MPYIKQTDRADIDVWLSDRPYNTASGVLAYTFYKILKEESKGMSYYGLATLVGVLETVKMEFNRRVVVPYERKKCEENGDA